MICLGLGNIICLDCRIPTPSCALVVPGQQTGHQQVTRLAQHFRSATCTTDTCTEEICRSKMSFLAGMPSAILKWLSCNWKVKKWRTLAFNHLDTRFHHAEPSPEMNGFRSALQASPVHISHWYSRLREHANNLRRWVVHPIIHRVSYYTF